MYADEDNADESSEEEGQPREANRSSTAPRVPSQRQHRRISRQPREESPQVAAARPDVMTNSSHATAQFSSPAGTTAYGGGGRSPAPEAAEGYYTTARPPQQAPPPPPPRPDKVRADGAAGESTYAPPTPTDSIRDQQQYYPGAANGIQSNNPYVPVDARAAEAAEYMSRKHQMRRVAGRA